MGCVDICLEKKKGRFWGEAVAGYLWRQCSGLLVDCCGWVLILGSVCVEICRGCAHWESGTRCMGVQAAGAGT